MYANQGTSDLNTFWDKQIATFNKKYPGVKVKVQYFPFSNRATALQTALAAGKGPDVVYLIPNEVADYASNLVPASQWLSPTAMDNLLPNVVKSVTYQGNLLGLPVLTNAYPLLCDKKAFDAVGNPPYPKTWDDVLALGPKFKAAGMHVLTYDGTPSFGINVSFYPWLWQAGGAAYGPDGEIAINSPAGVEALTFVKKLVDNGYVAKDPITTVVNDPGQVDVGQNKVACTSEYLVTQVKPYWGASNIVVLPPLKDKVSVGYGTVGTLTMLKGAKDKDAAAAWLNWVAQPAVTKAFDIVFNYYSPDKNAGNLYPNDPALAAVGDTVSEMSAGVLNPSQATLDTAAIPEIQAALLGKESPKQALDKAVQEAKAAS